jgi:RNA polymerase sigma-70 factor (ECF subfamily)
LQALANDGPRRESALAELYAMLLRAARREAARRGPKVQITGPELEDLAYQAAGDALLAITQMAGQFRGKAGSPPGLQVRHLRGIGQDRAPFLAPPDQALGCRELGPAAGPVRFDPAQESEWRDLLAALRRAVDTELPPASARSSSQSPSTMSCLMPWRSSSDRTVTRSTR